MQTFDFTAIAIICAAYAFGNVIKGVIGFGTLFIAVPLTTMVVGPSTAIALTAGSVVVSNVWQLADSGHAGWAVRRLWPMLLVMASASAVGSQFLARVDPSISGAVIGVLVIGFCITRLVKIDLGVPSGHDRVVSLVAGVLAGLVGGATILSGSVLIAYLVALRLEKNHFVAAVALSYLVSTAPAYATLMVYGRYTMVEGVITLGLILPAVAALAIGRRLRHLVSQGLFEKVVLVMLFAIGIATLGRSL